MRDWNVAGADWQAMSMQLALFTQRALPIATDLFKAFAGADPDSEETQVRQGSKTQSGRIDNARLRVVVTPVRVDFFLAAPPLEASWGPIQITTGELKAELGKFSKLCLDWLPKWDVPTTRLALVVKTLAWGNSSEQVYEILQQNLASVRVRPTDMNDLLFRINWKAKTSTISEGYYNRLMTWSAQSLRVTATPNPSIASGDMAIPLEQKTFAHLEMDLNTPAEKRTQLPPEKLGTILKDLHQHAIEIADTGEHP